ncbi:MAG: DUF1307 domain-containing protein [Vagococcus sp.]
MKKIWSLFLVVTMVVIFGACGQKEETAVYHKEVSPGVSLKVTYHYKGDEVTKLSTVNKIEYEKVGIQDKEEAKEVFEPMNEQFKEIKGIEHTIKFGAKEMTENLTIDYTKLDYEKAKLIPGIVEESEDGKGLSFKKSQEMLESEGFNRQ